MWLAGIAVFLAAAGPEAYPGSVTRPAAYSESSHPIIAQPKRMPRRLLRYELARDPVGDRSPEPWVVLLGEMAFHAPALLGPRASYHEVSCQACHPNGANNPEVEFEESYGVKGRIDLTTAYFSLNAEDGIRNARRIPSLRGVRLTAPYTAEGRTQSLKDQVRNVIVVEFGSTEPPAYLLDALVRFLEQLDPLPDPFLEGRGKLTAAASEAARRGEAAFSRSRAELDGASCATCHVPDRGFLDGTNHDIQGEQWNTPTLRGLDAREVYFHDATARSVPAAMEQVERKFRLQLEAREREDLIAYLQAIGAEEQPFEELTPAKKLERALMFLPLLTDSPYRDEPVVWRLTLDTALLELGRLRMEKSAAWAQLRDVVRDALKREPNAADREKLSGGRRNLLAETGR